MSTSVQYIPHFLSLYSLTKLIPPPTAYTLSISLFSHPPFNIFLLFLLLLQFTLFTPPISLDHCHRHFLTIVYSTFIRSSIVIINIDLINRGFFFFFVVSITVQLVESFDHTHNLLTFLSTSMSFCFCIFFFFWFLFTIYGVLPLTNT